MIADAWGGMIARGWKEAERSEEDRSTISSGEVLGFSLKLEGWIDENPNPLIPFDVGVEYPE